MPIKRFVLHGTLAAFALLSLRPLHGQFPPANIETSIQISGHFTDVAKYLKPWETNFYYFTALTVPDGWSLSVTNVDNSKDWGWLRSDGTNIYSLVTDVGDLPAGGANAYRIYGYVYPGEYAFPESPDSVDTFPPWVAFHLSPQMIQHFQHDGIIQMPCPWANARYSVLDYGCKWIVETSEDDQVVRSINIVRDTNLDLKTGEDEFRRTDLDYPFDLSTRNDLRMMLRVRKGIPNGFTNFSYECSSVYNTNNVLIPENVQVLTFWPDFKIQTA